MTPDETPQAQHPDPGAAALTAAQNRTPEAELEPLLAWDADEYVHYEKSKTWYAIAGVLALALIGYAIISESYLEAVAIALLTGVVYLYSHELPSPQRIIVNKLGIAVGQRFYPFTTIKSFWLILTPDVRTINLETTARFGQVVTILLGDTDPVLVRSVLGREVHEETGRDEGFLDRIARKLRL